MCQKKSLSFDSSHKDLYAMQLWNCIMNYEIPHIKVMNNYFYSFPQAMFPALNALLAPPYGCSPWQGIVVTFILFWICRLCFDNSLHSYVLTVYATGSCLPLVPWNVIHIVVAKMLPPSCSVWLDFVACDFAGKTLFARVFTKKWKTLNMTQRVQIF